MANSWSAGGRRIAAAIFAAHLAAAAAMWWLMPRGFPIEHWRFWSNTVVPLAMMAVAASGLIAIWRGWDQRARGTLSVLPAAWLGCGVAFAVTFPRSGWLLATVAIVLGAGLAFLARATYRRETWSDARVPLGALAMLGLGIVWAVAQRAPPAETRPLDVAAPKLPGEFPSVGLRPRMPVQVWPGSAHVELALGDVTLGIEPLLTFISRSPDRGWTLLAPTRDRVGPARKMRGMRVEPDAVTYYYQSDLVSSLRVAVSEADRPIELEALTHLDEPVYSHLNYFTDLSVMGHRALELEFSPCPGQRISAEPFQYPIGKPARCAYLDADEVFHVVQATSGEKGPFHELARGPMSRQDALGITLFDGGQRLGTVVFEDWAAQTSTQLSPTAGWGLPAGAIEFWRQGASPASDVSIFLTLASTSVGRGFDSVGHSAGTYRNRVRIERVARPPRLGARRAPLSPARPANLIRFRFRL